MNYTIKQSAGVGTALRGQSISVASQSRKPQLLQPKRRVQTTQSLSFVDEEAKKRKTFDECVRLYGNKNDREMFGLIDHNSLGGGGYDGGLAI